MTGVRAVGRTDGAMAMEPFSLLCTKMNRWSGTNLQRERGPKFSRAFQVRAIRVSTTSVRDTLDPTNSADS